MSNEEKFRESSVEPVEPLEVIPIDEKLIPPSIDKKYLLGGNLPIKYVKEGYVYSIEPSERAVGQEVRPYVHYVTHGTFFGLSAVITEGNLKATLQFRRGGFLAPIPNERVELYFVVKHPDGSKTQSKSHVYTIVA
ncbi:hypothetical protein FQ192_09430 [Pseudomonas sp. ANT_J12]|uniref:hypothetical protein n=1 Tax=Pseudomonas sp. ANT_J12 TaxID=2597351 RepID=UPI0011F2A1AE|nr:hypothetical protein [Pseudomonas sp. ANT_J12]KAA0995266.1 hypothetical protein FQ192_09430 [Pseudomonas sp. ANT_J12]